MKLYIFCLVKFVFYLSIVTAQEDKKCAGGSQQPILCQFGGKAMDYTYTFNIDDVLSVCNILVYSYYYIDGDLGNGQHVVVDDEAAIKSLVENNYVVYIVIGFMYDDEWWNLLYPPIEDDYVAIRDKLTTFLNTTNVKGILLDTPNIYCGPSNLAEKIDSFASEMKCLVPDLKVGIIIDGVWFENFPNNDLFDYTIPNNNMDMFIIDTTKVNKCNAETKKTGVVPITSDNSQIVSLEQITDAVLQSTMDKCRIYARMEVSVRMPKVDGENSIPKSYSEYCCDGSTVKSEGCAQTSTMLYEKGKHMKKAQFQGMMLSYMGTADSSNQCNCGRFSAINKIIDGWEDNSLEKCAKMDAP